MLQANEKAYWPNKLVYLYYYYYFTNSNDIQSL